MTTRLTINGVEKTFQQDMLPASLAELLAQMKIDQATVVAEIDGNIVPRPDFSTTPLAEGMKLELVRFVPGG